MSPEKTGGAFLLQEQEPKRLIGSLVSTTDEQGPGLVWVAFGDEDPRSKQGVVTEVGLSRDAALRLAGLLQILVAQNMCLRTELVEWRFVERKPVAFAVRTERGPRGLVFVSWTTGYDGVVWNEQGGHEWKLREDRALDLSFALISVMAHMASGTELEPKTRGAPSG